MLQFRRLNMDSSWWVKWGTTALLIDPWLVGSEVDGFTWFNEQWHSTPALPLQEIPAYEHILISQPYSDHCHRNTLVELSSNAKLHAVPPAMRRLKREIPERSVLPIETTWTQIGELQVARLTPDKLLDPIYHALVAARNDEALVYAPHGFKLNTSHLRSIEHLRVKLLITSFAYFRIPALLGGVVNPGTAGALALMQQLQPQQVVNTHDEDKRAQGVIIKLAKRIYPNMQQLAQAHGTVMALNDYSVVVL